MTIRTRFAPSPTGYLHIGGVRTALFNWLLARQSGGQFILRIDDTDAERNRPEALQPILDGFRWLGILWDEGPDVGGPHTPYFQSQRQEQYKAAALQLIDNGAAYPCYALKEELDGERKAAEAAKQNYIHRGKHRETSPEECRRLYLEKPTTLRLKVPTGRTIVIDDLISGKVEFQTDLMSDPVIVRPNGNPLYNFATVVDDVEFQITHVIRAKEHLSNTPPQILIYEGLNYPTPKMGHIPVVNAPNSDKKLSKRDMAKFMTAEIIGKLRAAHAVDPSSTDDQVKKREDLNPATVAFYQAMGYLPAALINYFGRLGWSLDDKTEIIPLDLMIQKFSLDRVNSSAARFDPEKLNWVQEEYMKKLPLAEKIEGAIPFLQRAKVLGEKVDAETRTLVGKVLQACGDRIKVYSDILTYGSFFFRPPIYDPKSVLQRLQKEGIPDHLRAFAKELALMTSFESHSVEAMLKEYCERNGIKLGELNHALRVATTGVMIGPSVFECLAVLGREETLKRIDTGLSLPLLKLS